MADAEPPAERRKSLLEFGRNVWDLHQTMRDSIAHATLDCRGGFTLDEFFRRPECIVDEEHSAVWFKALLDG